MRSAVSVFPCVRNSFPWDQHTNLGQERMMIRLKMIHETFCLADHVSHGQCQGQANSTAQPSPNHDLSIATGLYTSPYGALVGMKMWLARQAIIRFHLGARDAHGVTFFREDSGHSPTRKQGLWM